MSTWPLSTSETHICLSYGNPGAALYLPKDQNSKWIFAKNHKDIPLKALGHNIVEYNELPFFSEEFLNFPSRTLQEKYLKTNYSDIWVPRDLLRPYIKESGEIISTYNMHDALRGNLLAECQVWDPKNRNLSPKMLCFVSGENSTEISLATIKNYNTTIPRVSEVTKSIFSSKTPIRQVSNSSIYNGKYILLRNHTFSALIELIYQPLKCISLKNASITAVPLVIIENYDTENSEHSDIIFDFSNKNQLVVINKKGNWSLWNIEGRYRTIEKSSSNVLEDIGQNDGWWKMDWGSSSKSIIVSGRRKTGLFDLRDPSKQHLLYSLSNSDNILDFWKTSQNLSDFFILTTSEVCWLDERQPGKPLLSWKHYRSYDPSLKIIIDEYFGNFNLILYSNINPIKSCYQFSLKGNLPFSSIFPYELQNSQNTSITSIICPLNESTNKFESNNESKNDSRFVKLYSLGSEKNIVSQIYYYADNDTDSSESDDNTKKEIEKKNLVDVNNFIFREIFSKNQNKETDKIIENYEILTLRDIYIPSEKASFDEIFLDLKNIFQTYTEKGWKIYSLIPKSQKLLGFIDFASESDSWNFKNIYDTLIKHWSKISSSNNSSEHDERYIHEIFKNISIELGISSIGLKPPKSFMESKNDLLDISLLNSSFEIDKNNTELENIYPLLDEWEVGVNPDLYKFQAIDKTVVNDNIALFYEQTSSAPPRLTSKPLTVADKPPQMTDNINDHKFLSQPVKKIKSKHKIGTTLAILTANDSGLTPFSQRLTHKESI
ncbi:unnamed protein product [Pneumocystis jirovecii]|uniref:RRN6 beta-propeller domain-containing protein n=1 Tax=Pneumocystis jirovecii TaxID=42068 RepID=L0P8H3_PNEJI|nr:unnamed protein product [Pneumocystis jirovecii]